MTRHPPAHDHERGDDRAPAHPADPASQSLADALRVSFRVLTVVMVLVVLLFFATGVRIIQPQEMGIKKVFGRVTGTAQPGLAITWPFPIGEIEVVPVREDAITVDDFYMTLSAADLTKEDLSEVSPPPEGLRPGWDGFVVTGDRNLLHVKLTCNYRIQDAVACTRYVGDLTNEDSRKRMAEMVRATVCRAVIEAAARRTADGIMTKEKLNFTNDVKEGAQRQLNLLLVYGPAAAEREVRELLRMADARARARVKADLDVLVDLVSKAKAEQRIDAQRDRVLAGLGPENRAAAVARLGELENALARPHEPVRISRVSVKRANWPLKALPAYNAAQRAVQEKQKKRDEAVQEAERILRAAAGPDYAKLVGKPWETRNRRREPATAPTTKPEVEPLDRIGQYQDARDAGDVARAEALLRKIDEILVSSTTTGEAAAIIAKASAYSTAILQRVKGRVKQFDDLLPEYEKAPRFMLERLWADTLDEILGSPLIEKYYISFDEGPGVLIISRDPRVTKRIEAEKRKRKEQGDRERRGAAAPPPPPPR